MNRRLLTVLLFVAVFLAGYAWLNPLRTEHVAALGMFSVAAALPRTRKFGLTIFPILAFALIYDMLRIFADRAVKIVSIETVPAWENALFGFHLGGELVAPNVLLAKAQALPLDLIGAAFYMSHLAGIFGLAAYLFWKTQQEDAAEATEVRLHQFLWGFLALNILANLTQVLWPVAPPWYIDAYGFAAPQAQIPGDPAGLARVDAWLGIEYFTGVYSKGSYVFGAMPSLHVAFPAWYALHTRRWWSKAFGIFYVGGMSFFAVYFNHHYVLDVVAGAALAAGVYYVLHRTAARDWPLRAHRFLESLFDEDSLAARAEPLDGGEEHG